MFPQEYFPTGMGSIVLDGDLLSYRKTDGTKYTIGTTFHPANLPGLQLWLRADAITDLLDGGAVTSWPDSSGNGRHASQSSASFRPSFRAIARNGRPAVLFNGTSQFLDGPSANWRSVFAVARCGTTPSDHMSLWGCSTSGVDLSIRRFGSGPSYSHNNANDMALASGYRIDGVVTNQVPNGVWHVVSCLSPVPRTFPYRVGGTGLFSTARLWTGEIAEILIYDAALTPSNFQKVEQYLANKYALPDAR